MKRALYLFFFASLFGCRARELPDVELRFAQDGVSLEPVRVREIAARVPPVSVTTDDPYYGKRKRFLALPLGPVLDAGFGGRAGEGREVLLRAQDGYAVPVTEELVRQPGAYLAFADEDVRPYEPIGPRDVSPFPLYLVWTEPGQGQLETHPRPWQLVAIERVHFDVAYPHTAPPAEDGPAQRGYVTYRAECFKCHAINREGGRIGPELNVPQNVLEYLPESYVRAYIRKPSAFRYGVMPSHESLSDVELDDLIAYLRAMGLRKHDSGP